MTALPQDQVVPLSRLEDVPDTIPANGWTPSFPVRWIQCRGTAGDFSMVLDDGVSEHTFNNFDIKTDEEFNFKIKRITAVSTAGMNLVVGG